MPISLRSYASVSALVLAMLTCGCAGARAAARASSTYPSSCVDEHPPRGVANIELDELVAVDRGVRWFQAGLHGLLDGLAWLRADGELGFVQIGTVEQLQSGDYGFWECTAEGAGAVRCFNAPTQRNTGAWSPFWSVRVELSDTPQVGEIERWDGGPHDFVQGVASDGEHALVLHNEYRYEEPEYARSWEDEPLSATAVLTMWDVAGRRSIADVRIDGVIHEVVTAWCADTCTAVVLYQEEASYRGSPPMRRLLAVTLPSGRARTLSDGVYEPTLDDPVTVVRSGDSVILA